MAWRGVTDRQWGLIRPHLPPRKVNPKGGRPLGGRPRVLRGGPVDPLDRSPLERAAPAVREPHHLLAEAQGVGDQRLCSAKTRFLIYSVPWKSINS